jgi:hypothetical protein
MEVSQNKIKCVLEDISYLPLLRYNLYHAVVNAALLSTVSRRVNVIARETNFGCAYAEPLIVLNL